ncbi:hypothetical protein MRX96_012205 [Rhipicephalus microplus]
MLGPFSLLGRIITVRDETAGRGGGPRSASKRCARMHAATAALRVAHTRRRRATDGQGPKGSTSWIGRALEEAAALGHARRSGAFTSDAVNIAVPECMQRCVQTWID